MYRLEKLLIIYYNAGFRKYMIKKNHPNKKLINEINDQYLINEYCPWYKYILSHTKNGLEIFGIRIPIINYFDGPL